MYYARFPRSIIPGAYPMWNKFRQYCLAPNEPLRSPQLPWMLYGTYPLSNIARRRKSV